MSTRCRSFCNSYSCHLCIPAAAEGRPVYVWQGVWRHHSTDTCRRSPARPLPVSPKIPDLPRWYPHSNNSLLSSPDSMHVPHHLALLFRWPAYRKFPSFPKGTGSLWKIRHIPWPGLRRRSEYSGCLGRTGHMLYSGSKIRKYTWFSHMYPHLPVPVRSTGLLPPQCRLLWILSLPYLYCTQAADPYIPESRSKAVGITSAGPLSGSHNHRVCIRRLYTEGHPPPQFSPSPAQRPDRSSFVRIRSHFLLSPPPSLSPCRSRKTERRPGASRTEAGCILFFS